MRFRPFPLTTEEQWQELEQEFGRTKASHPAKALVEYLRKRGKARYALVEIDYVDRDHRASAASLYARQFSATARLCERYHFFDTDSDWEAMPEGSSPPAHGYLGFVVRRPVPESRIGRSVLALTSTLVPSTCVPCAAEYSAHVNETTLTVAGVPYCEQDGTIMSCAETSILIASSIMKELYDHPLVLAPHIATPENVGIAHLGRLLPTNGLTTEQMTNILSSLGFGTLCYAKRASNHEWGVIPLAAPYVASGIPLILVGKEHAVDHRRAMLARPDGKRGWFVVSFFYKERAFRVFTCRFFPHVLP
jgi:hypothetical protein